MSASVAVSPEAMAHQGWGDHDVAGRLGGIAVPTLVLAGAQDRMMPPGAVGAVGAVARGIPGAGLVVIEDAGHFAYAEQPDAYFAALSGWLDSGTSASGEGS
jgi:proline iminopeptidase